MCGILGAIPKADENRFKESLDKIAHRGPDAAGILHLPDISLGHRRLAILDLTESGTQPMNSRDGRYIIIYNGEIYNYLEIKAELEQEGAIFTTNTDTEVVLAAFIYWKEHCLLKFNGMWSFAIWDCYEKKLFLSRDRFGKKPLFYIHDNEKFVFASEMKSLIPFLSKVRPHKNFNQMRELPFNYEKTEDCLIEGIKRFPAGSFGILQSLKLKITRYWNTLDHLITPASNYDDQVEEFRELFLDACKIRLRSDVPIGTALSGGLDSSATIAISTFLAKKHTHSLPKAFVASFPDSSIDETFYAQKVVKHLNIESKFIKIEPLTQWDNIIKYIYLTEELYITSPIPMLMTYQSIKNSGVSVTLDGHGADELFSGYGHVRTAYLDVQMNYKSISEIYRTLHNEKGTFSKIISEYLLTNVKERSKKYLNLGVNSTDCKHLNFKALDHFTRDLYIIFHETILPTLLRNYDRYSMANSVEIRMPFMDHRIVSYVFSLGYHSKIKNTYTKSLIRDAISPYLPEEITYRKTKFGFNSPFHEWIKGPLKQYFLDTIHSSSFLNAELLPNSKDLANMIIKFIHDNKCNYADGEKIWQNFQPFLWEQAFIKNPGNGVNSLKY